MSVNNIAKENIRPAPSTPTKIRGYGRKPDRLPNLESLSISDDPSDSEDTLSTTAQPDRSPDMAALAGEWQRNSTLPHSSDTVSPIYPDRLIRPLPKRNLRSRLSEGQAGSITYPPNVSSSPSMLSSPQSQAGNNSVYYNDHRDHLNHDDSHDEHTCACGGDLSEVESEDEDEGKARLPSGWVSRQPHFHGPSSTSSADGYESFENTNNKKKRKIPVAGSGLIGPDVNASDGDHSESRSQAPTNGAAESQNGSGVGIPGAGKGRYGRQSARSSGDRRPLGASQNGSNSNASTASNKMKRDWNAATAHQSSDPAEHGIVPTAIASAERRNGSIGSKTQEHANSLQRQQQGSQGKDFTFECKSNSSNRMGMNPPPSNMGQVRSPGMVHDTRAMASQGTQTSRQQTAPQANDSGRRQGALQAPVQGQPASSRPRRPRRPEQEYAAAARQRQLQKDIDNYHHPPRKEDIWICEFCEYEAIWGKPPVALVRQYEIKDRKERKAAEERRRLLEKAKAKSRKNRKGKGNGKGASVPPTSSQHYDHEYDNMPSHEGDSQGEEYYDEDDYDDSGGGLGYEDEHGYGGQYEPALASVANGHAVPPAGGRG